MPATARAPPRAPASRLAVPFQPPVNLLEPAVPEALQRRLSQPQGRAPSRARSAYQGFFFPLDGVRDWNRLYGPRGLYQHQSVVPEDDRAQRRRRRCSSGARAAGQGSFLTVLKRFGPIALAGHRCRSRAPATR